MKLIIAGSRHIHSYSLLEEAVGSSGFKPTEIFSGCAGGVDQLGEQYATEHAIVLRRFYADWSIFGKSAGPIRNREMAENADALIALWDGASRGTSDMIKKAIDCNLKVKVFLITKEHGTESIEEVRDFSPKPSIREQAKLHGINVSSLDDQQAIIDVMTGKRIAEECGEEDVEDCVDSSDGVDIYDSLSIHQRIG